MTTPGVPIPLSRKMPPPPPDPDGWETVFWSAHDEDGEPAHFIEVRRVVGRLRCIGCGEDRTLYESIVDGERDEYGVCRCDLDLPPEEPTGGNGERGTGKGGPPKP